MKKSVHAVNLLTMNFIVTSGSRFFKGVSILEIPLELMF